jgi:hypothetical protein
MPPSQGLLKWVFAMVNYFGVAKGVEPKRKKVGSPGGKSSLLLP